MRPNNGAGLIYILLTVVFTVAGQLLIKKGMSTIGAYAAGTDVPIRYLVKVVTSFWIIGGFACAGLAAANWTLAMARCELSFAYPFMGLAIVFTLALTPLLFHERISYHQWLGVLIVCFGVWLASRPK